MRGRSENYKPHVGDPVAVAYLAGVLNGDGCLDARNVFRLQVKDRDFADAFAGALLSGFGCHCNVRPRKHYWVVTRFNGYNRFDHLRAMEPGNHAERAAWLKGLFDSEGNAALIKRTGKERSFQRRASMYSTNQNTLNRAVAMLDSLGIPAKVRTTKNSATHLGSKTVYELLVRPSRSNYRKFLMLVGSSIYRKRLVLESIVASYQDDISACCRDAQLRGAATKRARALSVTLPDVLDQIRGLVSRGINPTQRRCWSLSGYAAVSHHFLHSKIVAMALQGEFPLKS